MKISEMRIGQNYEYQKFGGVVVKCVQLPYPKESGRNSHILGKIRIDGEDVLLPLFSRYIVGETSRRMLSISE